MTHAVELDGLTRRFGERTAVDALTFAVAPGEVFGMLGPNGAGKTTTVRLLNGVLDATSGGARVLGFDPFTEGDRVRARTGVLTETPSLYEQLNARDNLRIFAALYGVPGGEIAAKVDGALAMLGLDKRSREKVGGYSKGMKQRLAIARALIHEPPVLFLDEPTAGLDPEAARQITDLIVELSSTRGRTILLATHNLTEAQRLCDRVAVLKEGRVLALGAPAELGRTLWAAQWVDVALLGSVPAGLVATLKETPGVLEVQAQDHTLALRVAAEDAIPGAVVAAAGAGARIVRVLPREHTLEEVYFELQKREKVQ